MAFQCMHTMGGPGPSLHRESTDSDSTSSCSYTGKCTALIHNGTVPYSYYVGSLNLLDYWTGLLDDEQGATGSKVKG